jgi:hypothetical protein
MAVILSVIVPLTLRFLGVPAPLWLWISVSAIMAVINFGLFIGAFSLMRRLRAAQVHWDTPTKRRFRTAMLLIAVAFFAAAFYFYTQ